MAPTRMLKVLLIKKLNRQMFCSNQRT